MPKAHEDMVNASVDALHTLAHRLCDQPFFALCHASAEAARNDPAKKTFDATAWNTIYFLLSSNLHVVHGSIRRGDHLRHECKAFTTNVQHFLNDLRNSSLMEIYHIARAVQDHRSWDLDLIRLLLSTHPGEYLIDSWLASPVPSQKDDEDHAEWI